MHVKDKSETSTRVFSKNFEKKKKVSGEMAFDAISFFHVQIQEPTSRSTTTRAFVFPAKFGEFYYHKIFEVRSRLRPKRLRG